MNVAIIGSRGADISVRHVLEKRMLRYPNGTRFVSGGAGGPDTWARTITEAHISRGFSFHELKPDYDKHGRSAPHVRNSEIIECVHEVIAVWDGKSKGTKSTFKKALKRGLPVLLIPCKNKGGQFDG